ncbi:MAG: tRNA (adenosine(37)-N6)-threonylcarbamoyltransferase complex transferase subunit TsaD [Thermoanaerobacterales bacterium]|nr:tRNA (adenosine(37)-N6)-threonylcarbamoyltransferase complex transferase subunit TsaD [Thermoanaerobacterales bacterium]
MDRGFLTLGIESSCDETSASVVKDGRTILSNCIFSQIKWHQKFGGVVPEIASRKHLEAICHTVQEALEEANVDLSDINLIAVTHGPGLVGALLVGVSYAKGLAYSLKKPLIGVNHIEGHIFANFLETDFEPPFLCLIVSGGHTHLVLVKDYFDYKLIGKTVDDAAGEAFDKVARALGLGYPGGPKIDKAALQGNEKAVQFPVAHLKEDDLSFSFSGLKSAVLNHLNNLRQKGLPVIIEDISASFQKAVVDALVENTTRAAIKFDIKKIALAGGVASNTRLRKRFADETAERFSIFFPPPVLCTDNAAMIACAGYYRYLKGFHSEMSLNAHASLTLS